MNLFGLTVSRQKSLPAGTSLSPVESRGGWWPVIREAFAGAWQQNVEVRLDSVLTYSAVWACITLIASDISKLWLNLVEQDQDGIWSQTESPAFSPILRKPNHYQNRIKFFEWWITSKLIHGNTYALKERDNRNVITALYLLDPQRVTVLVAPDGSVFYQLGQDYLSAVDETNTIVPASEIIHDIMSALYHPLVGISPISACGLAAIQGLKIQNSSAKFFGANSQPPGILTAPLSISAENAERIKAHWEANYMGQDNIGKVAVLGDGLKYEPMAMTAVDAQLIDQLKWTAETVCSCFHVPPYMVGVGPMPTYTNIQALSVGYYSQCLQNLIECLELCLDEGLELPKPYGVEFDLDALLRMDTATAIDSAVKGIVGGLYKPNEGRAKFDLKPVTGGDTPYLQQQQFSLAALDARDRAGPPPPTMTPTLPSAAPQPAMKAFDESGVVALYRTKAAALGLPVDVDEQAA